MYVQIFWPIALIPCFMSECKVSACAEHPLMSQLTPCRSALPGFQPLP